MQYLLPIARVFLVVLLLAFSALLATPPGRLPLVLRGLKKILGKQNDTTTTRVSLKRKFFSLLLLLITLLLALY